MGLLLREKTYLKRKKRSLTGFARLPGSRADLADQPSFAGFLLSPVFYLIQIGSAT